MVQCCILGCQNRTEQGLSDVTFHRFPSSAELVEIWKQACGRFDWRPTQNSRICSNHFKSDLFVRRGNKKFLKPGALPTNNIYTSDLTSKPGRSDSTGQSKFFEKSPETLDLEKTRKHNIETPETSNKKPLEENRQKNLQTASDLSSKSGVFESSKTKSDIFEKTIELPLKDTSRKRKLEEMETPRKKKLRNIAANRLKKLHAVRQAKRRLLKRNAELNNIKSELRTKSLLSYEDDEFLNSIDTVNRDFLKL